MFEQMPAPPLGKPVCLNLHVTVQALTYTHTLSALISGSQQNVTLYLPNLLFKKPKTITVSRNRAGEQRLD